MTSIPVSRAEFMKLVSRIEQLEAEISLFRNWMEKKCGDGKAEVKNKKESSRIDDENDSKDEEKVETSLSSASGSHKRLLGKTSRANIHFQ